MIGFCLVAIDDIKKLQSSIVVTLFFLNWGCTKAVRQKRRSGFDLMVCLVKVTKLVLKKG